MTFVALSLKIFNKEKQMIETCSTCQIVDSIGFTQSVSELNELSRRLADKLNEGKVSTSLYKALETMIQRRRKELA